MLDYNDGYSLFELHSTIRFLVEMNEVRIWKCCAAVLETEKRSNFAFQVQPNFR